MILTKEQLEGRKASIDGCLSVGRLIETDYIDTIEAAWRERDELIKTNREVVKDTQLFKGLLKHAEEECEALKRQLAEVQAQIEGY